jgi:hypothetical protein
VGVNNYLTMVSLIETPNTIQLAPKDELIPGLFDDGLCTEQASVTRRRMTDGYERWTVG